jgi:hypothetical protein
MLQAFRNEHFAPESAQRKFRMKLRVMENSLRLRLSPKEVGELLARGRVEETLYFGREVDARFTYALEHTVSREPIRLRSSPQQVVVVLSTADATLWAEGDQVGIYGDVETAHGALALSVEKDFACLDRSDADNAETFPNPKAGEACL